MDSLDWSKKYEVLSISRLMLRDTLRFTTEQIHRLTDEDLDRMLFSLYPLPHARREHFLLCKGERKAETTALTCNARAFYPDMAIHRFHEILANIQSQTGAAHRACQIALQAHELTKEQRYLVGWNTRSLVLDADTDL